MSFDNVGIPAFQFLVDRLVEHMVGDPRREPIPGGLLGQLQRTSPALIVATRPGGLAEDDRDVLRQLDTDVPDAGEPSPLQVSEDGAAAVRCFDDEVLVALAR